MFKTEAFIFIYFFSGLLYEYKPVYPMVTVSVYGLHILSHKQTQKCIYPVNSWVGIPTLGG